MVSPEWQGVGLGTALQARLLEYAMSRGVRGFVADILPRNASMLRLIARAPGVVLKQYPREIYDWIQEMGGVGSMTIDFWELRAPTLWQIGYRKCRA